VTDALPHHLLMIERVRSRAHEFDVLHFHVEHGGERRGHAALARRRCRREVVL
jgi:hypothetical protein